ncbi:hypothetical protein VKS41_005548 [Umbelopsis sp. WA50703]
MPATRISWNAETKKALTLYALGFASVLMVYSIHAHIKTLQNAASENGRRRRDKWDSNKKRKLENAIDLRTLALLTQSDNVNLHNSAAKIVLERAMLDEHLPSVIQACRLTETVEYQIKGISALQLLSRTEANKKKLVDAGALDVLVDMLKSVDKDIPEATHRSAAVALCDLIQSHDDRKIHILETGVLDPLKRILTSETLRNNELKYWSLMVLHQVSLSEPFHRPLITNGFVAILAKMARMTFGNTNMPKFCMQSLVRVIASVDPVEARAILTELLDYNIVSLISVCLRSDDVELIYWAAGLMHEFVLKDVAAAEFRQIKGVQSILLALLSADEMYISRVVLRTIKFMAHGQDNFRLEMVRTGLITKIMHCLVSEDDDVKYWAVLCTHEAAGQVEAHADIITANEFPTLLELGTSNKIQATVFVADILSLICCINSNNGRLGTHSEEIVNTLNKLLIWEEPDVQYNAAGALFNMMAMSDDFTSLICDKCLNSFITVILETNRERVQLTCAKALLMLGIRDQTLVTRIILQVIEPLMARFVELCYHATPVFVAGLTLERKFNATKYMAPTLDDTESESGKEELPDYISITPGGYISNASRLDQQLQAVMRPRDAQSNNSGSLAATINRIPNVVNSSSSHEALRAAYDRYTMNNNSENASASQQLVTQAQASNLPQAEITTAYKEKMLGTLNSLRVLMENETMFSRLLSGSIFEGMIVGMQAVERMMDIIAERYSESGEDEDITLAKRQKRKQSSNVTGDAFRDFDTGTPKGSRRESDCFKHTAVHTTLLPDTVQSFVDSLVHLAVLPAINVWAFRYNMCSSSPNIDYEAAKEKVNTLLEIVGGLTNVAGNTSTTLKTPEPMYRQGSSDVDTDDNDASKENEQTQSQPKLQHLTASFQLHRECGKDPEVLAPSSNFKASAGIPKLRKSIIPYGTRALLGLRSLVRYKPVRNYLELELGFISIMINLYQECRSMSESVILCLGIMLLSDPTYAMETKNLQLLAPFIWKNVFVSLSQTYTHSFYSQSILTYCRELSSFYCRRTWNCNDEKFQIQNRQSKTYVYLEKEEHSKLCILDIENWLEVRNDSWTFETLRATHGTPVITEASTDKLFAFEVEPCTDGLIQVGWASQDAQFDPEGGMGVGDDDHSYAFDGCRAQKWHGRWSDERSSYGQEWNAGDVITCLLDLDAGKLSYYRNGADMGVAFEGVPSDRSWFPAVSVSTSQGCKLYFGSNHDPLRYAPEGYKGMATLTNSSASLILPPPHIKIPTPINVGSRNSSRASSCVESSTQSSVIQGAIDEAIAIASPDVSIDRLGDDDILSASSSVNNEGNVEPNLIPIDRVPPWEETPYNVRQYFSAQNNEPELEIFSETQEDIIPSLYFEVEIGLQRISELDFNDDDTKW